jgi:hypothetical protein
MGRKVDVNDQLANLARRCEALEGRAPTIAQLQESAFELLDRMIAVGKP